MVKKGGRAGMSEYMPFDCDECDTEFNIDKLSIYNDRILCEACRKEEEQE